MRRIVLPAALAVGILALALDGGAFSLESRGTVAVGIWWTVLVTVAVGLLPVAHVPRSALLAGASLVAFAAVTACSLAWSDSAERTIAEFDRVALYVGAFGLAAGASRLGDLDRWSDGLALGVVLVALVALVSRLFSDLALDQDIPRFLPDAQNRLSFPVGYWNGLAVLVALAFPMLLRAAVDRSAPLRRGIAVGVLPALVAVLFLTSSRGGSAAAIAGVAILFALSDRRLALVGALLPGIAGSALAVIVLLDRPALVDGPLRSAVARDQGRSATALLLLVCTASGVAYVLGSRFIVPRRRRVRSTIGATALLALAAPVAIALVWTSPLAAFERFREPPDALAPTGDPRIATHLLSSGGSGRWQFWTAALDAFETRPVFGHGAGSYEAWWAQHGTLPYFVRNAHSLYLEVLAELGVVGLALLLAAFATAIASGATRARSAQGHVRLTLSALTASFAAFVLAAGVDWVWEVTIVGLVGAVLSGLLVGSAVGRRTEGRGFGRVGRTVVAVAALGIIVCQALPLLATISIRESQEAVRRGDVHEAVEHARDARALQPWAASGYLQLALVEEQRGDIPAAREQVREALARDRSDWRLWLVAARLEVKAGAVADARASLARARALNPRSPLFAKVRT